MSVCYTLDEQAIAPEALTGQSGHVTISFDYQNVQYEEVLLDGKTKKIYVPFTMLTGMLLDTEVFRNVTISNGKLINDGDRIAVVGIAFPGLQEDLAINKEKLDIPDYVEISADVENFEMGMTMTLSTTELFGTIGSDKLDLHELSDAMAELTDAMDQLLDGSSQLYDGLCTLLKKSGDLVYGMYQPEFICYTISVHCLISGSAQKRSCSSCVRLKSLIRYSPFICDDHCLWARSYSF